MVASTRPLLLDQHGNEFVSDDRLALIEKNTEVMRLRREISRGIIARHQNDINARFDSAQTVEKNFRHWQNADFLDPHASAILAVRRTLRIRSRYEIIENNPYLKGCSLTLANDFVGSGPKLALTEKTWTPELRQEIEAKFEHWWDACDMTSKLWRLKMQKFVDGESFGFAVTSLQRRLEFRDEPVTLDFQLVEADRVSSPLVLPLVLPTYQNGGKVMEADGVRWDLHENPISYNLLPYHPGNMLFPPMGPIENWIRADNVLHWFRQDRGWLRGIPELTTSLPLCALLRRYTLAVVQAAEIGAMISAVIESEAPPQARANQPSVDDPFDVFPMEPGMIMRMPWGYKMSQIDAKQPIQVYDMFVGALLREIMRPAGMPFGLVSGTYKEANMASAIVDQNLYQTTQGVERSFCERKCLNMIFCLWYMEAIRLPGYLPAHKNALKRMFPSREWRWPKVGLDHTDPEKVMNALQTAREMGFLTDRDIQEKHFSRDVDDWRQQIEEDQDFRESIDMPAREEKPEPAGFPGAGGGGSPSGKAKPKPKSGKAHRWTEEDIESTVKRLMNGHYQP